MNALGIRRSGRSLWRSSCCKAIEHVLHGDVARELRDAIRHALVVAHREIGSKAGG